MPGAPPVAEESEPAEVDEPFSYDPAAAATVDYRSAPKAPLRRRKPPMFKTLGFRRTVIPVMLTTGVLMIVMAAGRWVVDEEAPLARLPAWASAVLIVTGLLLLALGVANMLMVRGELAKPPA